MKGVRAKYIDVVRAHYVEGYKLRLAFSDGTERVVDFEPFLRENPHPDFEKYRALRTFKSFHIQHGNLMWGDYEMIFPVWDLYCGTI